MTRRFPAFLAFFAAIIIPVILKGQALPVNEPVLEDYFRRAQLMGTIDSSVSFMIRPIYPSWSFNKSTFLPDSGESARPALSAKFLKRGEFKILPVSVDQLYNSKVPTGWNDESFIPAKGYQVRASAGFYVKYGPVSLQAMPEIVTAANKNYDGFPTIYADFFWGRYYEYLLNRIDRPERFGTGSYSRLLPGQSSFRITVKPVSLGISSENLWWGPGQYNSLIMSNTAQGFYHLTFNTVKPIATPVGSFEFQAIAGRLEDSNYDPPETQRLFFAGRNKTWRYLSGITATWKPRFLEGLFLGYARTLQTYNDDIKGSFKVPFVLPFKRFMANGDQELMKYDQYYTLFARWLFVPANGEVYFEYGRNNHPFLFENYPVGSGHSRAYIIGLKKLLPLRNNRQMQVNLELAELNSPPDYISKPGEAWYVNSYVRQGYTNKGKILGAGIGPGGSLQTLDVSWFSGMKRIGLQLDRYVHNNDLYYFFFGNEREVRRHWVDLNATAKLQTNYKNLVFKSDLALVHALDYQYYFLPERRLIPFAKGRDLYTFRAEMHVSYRFN